METFGKPLLLYQPAAEPNSYWVRFPDNSILRRTRSMIKPRSLPSHFKLHAAAQPWNFEEKTNSRSYDSFNQLNGNSMLPVTPMTSVTTSATTYRDSKVSETTDPIISTEALQPTMSGPSVPSKPKHSTRSTKGVPTDRYTTSKKWLSWNTVDVSFVQDYVVKVVRDSYCLVFQVYGPVKHGTMWNIPHL